MGYRQLSIEERCEIARLRAEGAAVRQIAAALDRAPSTVARELKRNGSRTGGYRPVYAHEQARARRWSGARLERDDALRACVLERLSWGWSPEQIAGHLAEAAGRTVISYESIYRFIYAQAARHKNHAWRRYLPRAKWKRGRRRRKGSSSASFIAHRRPGGGAAAAAGAVTPWPGGNPWVRTRPRCAPARLSVSRKGALRRIPRRFRLAPVRPRGRRRPLSPTRGHGPDSRVIQTFVLYGHSRFRDGAGQGVGVGGEGVGGGRGWAGRPGGRLRASRRAPLSVSPRGREV